MTKRAIILTIITVLIIAGGVFWYKTKGENPPNGWDVVETSTIKDYTIQETENSIIFENKKDGLVFKISKDWIIKTSSVETSGFFKLYSPLAIEKNEIIMENGCRIMPEIIHKKTDVDAVKQEINESIWNPYLIATNIVEIDGQTGLKYIADSSELEFHHIGVIFPIQDRTYMFMFDSNIKDKEQCEQEFNDFLETIIIK